MPTLHSMIAVALAGLALASTPGPSMLYVLSRTVGQGRAAGIASALGLCVGGIVLAIATALGLAALFDRFDWLVSALRLIGAAYLLWLAVDMVRGLGSDDALVGAGGLAARIPVPRIFWQGVLIEISNPKTVLFFALFLPPFVEFGSGGGESGSFQQMVVLGMLVPLTAIPSDLLVAFLGAAAVSKIRASRKFRVALGFAAALILAGLSLRLVYATVTGQ